MSFRSRLRDTVTIYSYSDGAADRRNVATPSFDSGTAWPAWVEQLSTEELLTTGRDTRITRYMVLLPPEAAVKSTDEASWQGMRLRVVGDPKLEDNHSGAFLKQVVLEGIDEAAS